MEIKEGAFYTHIQTGGEYKVVHPRIRIKINGAWNSLGIVVYSSTNSGELFARLTPDFAANFTKTQRSL